MTYRSLFFFSFLFSLRKMYGRNSPIHLPQRKNKNKNKKTKITTTKLVSCQPVWVYYYKKQNINQDCMNRTTYLNVHASFWLLSPHCRDSQTDACKSLVPALYRVHAPQLPLEDAHPSADSACESGKKCMVENYFNWYAYAEWLIKPREMKIISTELICTVCPKKLVYCEIENFELYQNNFLFN